jgi:hypothetical protein
MSFAWRRREALWEEEEVVGVRWVGLGVFRGGGGSVKGTLA